MRDHTTWKLNNSNMMHSAYISMAGPVLIMCSFWFQGTIKMATTVLAETLQNVQHRTWFVPEGRRYALNLSYGNLRATALIMLASCIMHFVMLLIMYLFDGYKHLCKSQVVFSFPFPVCLWGFSFYICILWMPSFTCSF